MLEIISRDYPSRILDALILKPHLFGIERLRLGGIGFFSGYLGLSAAICACVRNYFRPIS